MKKPQKNPKKFFCKKCDFGCNNKKDFTRHLSTTKHKNDNNDNINDNSKNPSPSFVCVCGRKYKYRSGLSRHRSRRRLQSESPVPTLKGQIHRHFILKVKMKVRPLICSIKCYNKIIN